MVAAPGCGPGISQSRDVQVQVLSFHPYAEVAQLVEHGTENPCVGGSTPPLGTNSCRGV